MILSVKPIEPKQVVRRNEMKYTLRQLEIFLAVARHQNISRAAKSLHMSQSAASEALLNLEHTFDVTLFDRVSNRLTLNPVGHAVRKEAEILLARADRIIVMHRGRVRETGNHASLLEQQGIYYRLHQLQYRQAGLLSHRG